MSIPLELDNLRQSILIDVRKIRNIWDLKTRSRLSEILDVICEYNDFEIIEKRYDEDMIIYILSNSSHVSITSFPEKKYLAFDLYICQQLEIDDISGKIFEFLVQALDANPLWSNLQIIERKF
jgi:S-adenosylmethionine/arginine decarboxylase-like enzyme